MNGTGMAARSARGRAIATLFKKSGGRACVRDHWHA